ncbi:SDR family NAD(P)-dependent oxidoreductase [Rhizosaccharibacter radicis]|uniref:SDR family NAD(P)-dependent oxidoreductase n=1 Tax=Rhizosaccharibacter radicis TaxID=2782605 RepID=A0ABT1VV67_9PROT|nr:SDR family NAD(P)-dependent oxidoreductase [Acetobacteraceae bacterium KSS12]
MSASVPRSGSPVRASIVLVIGAARGLGLAMARCWLDRGAEVIATVRDPASPGDGLLALRAQHGARLVIEDVDVMHEERIDALRDRVAQRLRGRRLDVLLVNAGMTSLPGRPVDRIATADFNWVMNSNALGPMRAVVRLAPLLSVPASAAGIATDMPSPASDRGAVAVMSADPGTGNGGGGAEIFLASKAALNALLRGYAARQSPAGPAILALSPGDCGQGDCGAGPEGTDDPPDAARRAEALVAAIEARRADAAPQEPSAGSRALLIDADNRIVPW